MRLKPAIVAAFTALAATLIVCHVHDLNGPWYWKWSWRRLPWWTYLALLAAATPFAAAQWAYARSRLRTAIALLAVAALTLQFAAVSCAPAHSERIERLAIDPSVTSYWTDAKILAQQPNITFTDLMVLFPDIVGKMHVHARYKPPGLMLYYLAWIQLLGEGSASAIAGAIGVGIIAALAVPMCYRLIRFYTGDAAAAFCGASFMAISPSLILFFPQFDQAYVTIACLLFWLWGKSSRDLRWWATIACGATLALATFCSYIFLTLGCFIVVDWLLLLVDRGRPHFLRATRNGAIALVIATLIYLEFWALFAFNPISTFRAIAAVQSADLLALIRPFPQHIFWDVIDFGLGSGGWIGYLLLIFYLCSVGKKIFGRAPQQRFVLIALIQIFTVACAALLPGETARLWMLLIPLLMAPVGFELARWTFRARMVVYSCLWLMLAVICQNMTFLYLGEKIDGVRQYDSWPAAKPGDRR